MQGWLFLLIVMQDKITDEKMEIVRNLYLSGISEEFIALQLDLEIPVVIKILKELDVYKETGH
jgi:hypothetical protein